MCLQAQVIEAKGIPPPGSETASFAVVTFFARFSNSNISACDDGLAISSVKLVKSSVNPNINKCIVAILFSSNNNACCILLTVLIKRTSKSDRFLPSPAASSKLRNDFGTRNAVTILFCTYFMSSIAVRF